MRKPAENVVAFYNQRGTAEQWIKEGKAAIKWTRLSCRSFAANAVRLQLHALAYNLGNFMRTLAMPRGGRAVADEPQGKAHQDRREGGAPWPLRGVPVGRGRSAAANIPGHSAAHRGTATAAGPSVRHSTVMRATQRRERCVVMTRNRCLETPAVSKSPPLGGRNGYRGGPSLRREQRKRTLTLGMQAIRGISVKILGREPCGFESRRPHQLHPLHLPCKL